MHTTQVVFIDFYSLFDLYQSLLNFLFDLLDLNNLLIHLHLGCHIH